MIQDILDNTLLKSPAEEIELTYGSLLNRLRSVNLETDALSTAERIKESLRIGLELTLVVEMDHKLRGVQWITDVELFGIIRDEPVNEPE